QRPDVPAAELHRQRAHPRAARGRQVGGVASQQRGFGGQRDPGGEHQLSALQQVRRVGQLEHVDPADSRAQAVGSRDYLRAAAPDHVNREQVGYGGKHKTKRKASKQDTYIVSVHSSPRDREDWEPCLSFSPAIARSSLTGSVSTTTSRSRSSAERAAGSPTPRVAATSTFSPASSPTCSATTCPRCGTRSSGRSPAASCTPRRCT